MLLRIYALCGMAALTGVIVLLLVMLFSGCAHVLPQYNLLQITCPDGSKKEVKVPHTDNPELFKSTMNNRIRAACSIEKK